MLSLMDEVAVAFADLAHDYGYTFTRPDASLADVRLTNKHGVSITAYESKGGVSLSCQTLTLDYLGEFSNPNEAGRAAGRLMRSVEK